MTNSYEQHAPVNFYFLLGNNVAEIVAMIQTA